METTREIDWRTAEVRGGALTVELDGELDKEWKRNFRSVVRLLDRDGDEWREISIAKQKITVAAVKQGAEEAVRHLLEAAVQQVNADRSESQGRVPGTSASGTKRDAQQVVDDAMTETFRAFGPNAVQDRE